MTFRSMTRPTDGSVTTSGKGGCSWSGSNPPLRAAHCVPRGTRTYDRLWEPDAEAWEYHIAKGGQVEKELEDLEAEHLAFFQKNGRGPVMACARPTLERMVHEVSGFDLLDLSWELDLWQEYAEGLAEGGAGLDLQMTVAGHLAVIEGDVWAKRQAFDRWLKTLEMLRCPVNPWK